MRLQCKLISTKNVNDILSHYFNYLVKVLTTHHHISYITAHESAELATAYSNAQCVNSVIGQYDMYDDHDIIIYDQEFVYHPIGIYYIADLNDTYFIWANHPMLRFRQPTKLQDYRYIAFDQLRDLESIKVHD